MSDRRDGSSLALVLLGVLLSGCATPSQTSSAEPDLVREPVPRYGWDNSTISDEFTGWAVPPVASGAVPELRERQAHRVGVETGTRLLRLTLDPEPRDRAEFYVAPPSCKAKEVSECRSEEHYVDGEVLVYEVPWPEGGTWRFQVYGSGAGAAQVTYDMEVAREVPTAGA